MKLTLLAIFIALFVIDVTLAGKGRKNQGQGNHGRRGGHRKGSGRAPHHMCAGVFKRARLRPQNIDCGPYEDVITSDITDLYHGKQEDVFESWISMINSMTRREMESDDDMDGEDHTGGGDDASDDDDDELMMMCKRKLCFMKKFKEHSKDNGIPAFCNVDGRTAESWMELKEADRPQPGQPRQPMTVERYTTIFCAKAHNPGRHVGPGGRGNNGGRGGKGKGGRRGRGGRRRKTGGQEVSTTPQA